MERRAPRPLETSGGRDLTTVDECSTGMFAPMGGLSSLLRSLIPPHERPSMSPESVEARVAALQQKVDDLAEGVREYHTMVAGQAVLGSKLGRVVEDLARVEGGLVDLRFQIQRETQERDKQRQLREEKEAERDRERTRDRTVKWLGIVGIAVAAGSSIASLIFH